MKQIFTLLLVVAFTANLSLAQTIVGTEPENKNVVLEEFTGIHCVFCPQGHAIAQAIYDAHPEDVVLINIHTGSFAVPSGNEPDFRTPWGNAIAAQSNLAGYPAGTVNRHFFPGSTQQGGTAQSRNTWTNTSNIILTEPSYLNIAAEATIVNSTRQLVVYVEVYYTGDSPQGTNLLNVAILQNNILGPQTGGNMGNNYNHKHMLRHLLTGQWGVEIDETTEGSLYTGTFIYELPEDYNDVEVVLENLDIAAFVTETHQEVISGCLAEITMIESYDYDAAIRSAYVPQTACSGVTSPIVELKNYGVNTLSSLDFFYSANGEEPLTYQWTGSLDQNQTEMITLPEMVYPVTDDNEINIQCENPNGETDQLPQNDIFLSENPGSMTFPNQCYFGVETLGDPQDITWNIVDENGEILAEGGPYETGGMKITQLNFPQPGCYALTLYDASGNGLSGGFYIITDSDFDILWTGTSFTDMALAEFAYDIVIDVPDAKSHTQFSVYPNPVSHFANIEFTLESNTFAEVSVIDLMGREVKQVFEGEMAPGKQTLNFDGSDLNQGVYFIRLQMNNRVYTEKISVR